MPAGAEEERLRLYSWSVDRFRELGYEHCDAEKLQIAHVDWHELARFLLEHPDCSRELAMEIVS